MATSKVVQITNIAPQATRDQMQTLFGYLGKIEDIRLYPTIRDVACPVQSRICYVKFVDPACVSVAQHMTNTVFIDRALIVIPFQTTEIPDEQRALELTSNGTLVPGLFPAEPKLPPNVTNQLEGIPPNQVITTHDPRLVAHGLPLYPALSATLDAAKVEEIRRTVLVSSIDESVTALQLIDFFSEVAEVKYCKFCNRDGDPDRYALVELTDQNNIIAALQLNSKELAGKTIKVYHATQAVAKPQAKTNEAAQREIEEAMSRVKEAQNMISAAIDPVIGLLAKEKKRSRSRGRRSRSPSHGGRRPRRSRSRRRQGRSRSRSGSHGRRSRHSRSKSRERKRRSRSPGHSSRSVRSRSSSRRRSRSRSRRSHSKSKSKSTPSSKGHDKYKEKKDDKKDKKDDKRESKKDDAKDSKGDEKKEEESKREGSTSEYAGHSNSSKDKDSDKYKDKKYKEKSDKSKDSKEKSSKKKSSRDKSTSRSPSRNRHRLTPRRSRSPSRKKSPHSRRKSKSPRGSRSKPSPHRRSRSRSKSNRDDRKRDKERSRDKDPDKDRKKRDKREDKDSEKGLPSKVPRNYDEEEEGFDTAERGNARRDSSPSDGDYIEHNASDNHVEEKEQDMEISTSP